TTAPIHDPRERLVFTGPGTLVYQNLAALPRAFVAPTARSMVDPAAELRALSSSSFNPARLAIVDGPLPAGFGGEATPAAPTSATVAAYSGRKVSIRASGPGLLVLADTSYPGWTVKVDSRPAHLYTTDYAFRGVALGPGSHDVEFIFSPSMLKLGALGSALSLAAIILVLAFSAWLGAAPRQRLSLQSHTAGRVAKNALSPMASNFITKVLSFGFTIYYFPLFGVTQVGKYGVAVIVNLFMDTVISFGLQQLLMRDLARDKSAANDYITSGVTIRLALTAVVGLPVIAGVLALHHFAGFEADTTWVIVILTASFVPSAFATVFSSVFDGFELMEYRAGVNVLSGFLTVFFGVLFINLGWNIVGLAAAALLTNVLTAIAFYLLICRVIVRPRLSWNGGRLRYLLRSAWPVMVSQLLVVLFFNIDVPILRAFRGSFEVGLYTTAYKFVSAMLIVPPAFVTAVFPILSRQAVSQRESLRRGLMSSLKVLLIIAFPALAGFEVLAGTIVIGLYGSQFAGAVPALRILMLFLPFSYVNGLTQYVLIALDKQRTIVRFFGVTALFNIALNLVLIPSLGYIAASIVTVASEVVLLLPLCWLTARELGRLTLLSVATKPAIAAGLAGLAMLATQQLLVSARPIPVLLLAILCGSAVYTTALLALRTFTAEELRLARSLLRRRAPERLTAAP
ncbi:MAG: oligosaccharide flippase family protein, partial [Chloroflexota bacterium]